MINTVSTHVHAIFLHQDTVQQLLLYVKEGREHSEAAHRYRLHGSWHPRSTSSGRRRTMSDRVQQLSPCITELVLKLWYAVPCEQAEI